MKCPKCNVNLTEVFVSVHGSVNKVLSFQCSQCDYFEFEKSSSKLCVDSLRN